MGDGNSAVPARREGPAAPLRRPRMVQSARAAQPDEPSATVLLEVQGGRWGYRCGRGILYPTPAIDLAVQAGELVMLTGPNGSGKTTLLRGLLGLIPHERGVIHRNVSPAEVGYIPQESVIDRSLPATVMDIVRSGHPARWTRGRAAAREALEEVDLADQHAALFSQLSGGQRQRVLIARALTGHPRLLLLDEPTINVDLPTAERIGALLETLAAEGIGLLVTSHVTGWVAAAREITLAQGERMP